MKTPIDVRVIATTQRMDRYNYITKRMDDENIDYEMFISPQHKYPSIGCREAHYWALSKDTNYPVLILENDAEIPINFGDLLDSIMSGLDNYNIVLIGGVIDNGYAVRMINEYSLIQTDNVIGSHAYIVSPHVRGQLAYHLYRSRDHMDKTIGSFAKKYGGVYGFIPQLIRQNPDMQPGNILHNNVEHLVCSGGIQ